MILEFQKAEKQKAAKRNVDYFQRVCDANIMQVTLSSDQMRRKLTNPHNEVRYPRSHFPIL
jgi:hypothetical protein